MLKGFGDPFYRHKRGVRDKGLLFTICLYKIQAHKVHTHPYAMECIGREQLSYFLWGLFMCGWIMRIVMGWLGLAMEYFCRCSKKTLKRSDFQGQSAVPQNSLYRPPWELRNNQWCLAPWWICNGRTLSGRVFVQHLTNSAVIWAGDIWELLKSYWQKSSSPCSKSLLRTLLMDKVWSRKIS